MFIIFMNDDKVYCLISDEPYRATHSGSEVCTAVFSCSSLAFSFKINNPLGRKSGQHQFSPNNMSRSSRVKVMRITKLITKGRML